MNNLGNMLDWPIANVIRFYRDRPEDKQALFSDW